MKNIRLLLVLPIFLFMGTGCENIFSDSGDSQFEKLILPVICQSGSISITYPDSSATWWWGKQDVEITWEQKNPAGSVQLDLYKGDTFVNTIVSSTPNDGVYNSYTVPSDLSADFDYRVRISDDSGHYAFSEYFTIANYLIKITQLSGTINGQSIDPVDPEVTVKGASSLSGSVNVRVTNIMPAAAIAPLAATPTWGDPQSSYWEIDNWVGTGETDHVVDVDLTAPSEPGTYYMVIAMAGTYNSAQIMSGTHPGEPADWTNGNIVSLLDESEFETAIDQGYINFRWYHSVNGDMGGTMAMTAVRVIVEETVEGTYSFHCVDSEKETAYKEINFGDFTLQFDFKMEECTWSGGIAFGLWGDNVNSPNRVNLAVSNDDGGRVFILSIDGSSAQKAYYNYAFGTWYTAVLNYDWSEERLSCNIKDRSTGTIVATLEVTDSSIPRGASGILIGNPGGDGIGTTSCEIDNLIFTENGQVVVHEDFSNDPDWVVTDPSDLYRIVSSETFHLTCVESEGEYVFKDINYGDFSVQFDVKIDACTWSGGMGFGFWDADFTASGDVLFAFSNTDGGKCFILSVGDGGYQKVFYDYTFGAWYRCTMSYDWDNQNTSVVIKDRTTDAVVATMLVSGYAVPDNISRLILGDPGGDGIGMVSGEIDNIVITEDGQTVYDEDFSQDPGWTATDDGDLYWKTE